MDICHCKLSEHWQARLIPGWDDSGAAGMRARFVDMIFGLRLIDALNVGMCRRYKRGTTGLRVVPAVVPMLLGVLRKRSC